MNTKQLTIKAMRVGQWEANGLNLWEESVIYPSDVAGEKGTIAAHNNISKDLGDLAAWLGYTRCVEHTW